MCASRRENCLSWGRVLQASLLDVFLSGFLCRVAARVTLLRDARLDAWTVAGAPDVSDVSDVRLTGQSDAYAWRAPEPLRSAPGWSAVPFSPRPSIVRRGPKQFPPGR